jgi:hypothetical protein
VLAVTLSWQLVPPFLAVRKKTQYLKNLSTLLCEHGYVSLGWFYENAYL